MKLGNRNIGVALRAARDAAGNRCIYGVVWWHSHDGRVLNYRYPSVTLIGWRPHFEWK
jgi:hypothetical protein